MARPSDAAFASAPAVPANDGAGVPQSVRNLLTKARTAWLKNTEVLDLLSNYQRYNFTLNKTTPNCPPGSPSTLCVHQSHQPLPPCLRMTCAANADGLVE